MNLELACTLFTMAHIDDAIKCISAAAVENENIDKCIKILHKAKAEYMARARELIDKEESE